MRDELDALREENLHLSIASDCGDGDSRADNVRHVALSGYGRYRLGCERDCKHCKKGCRHHVVVCVVRSTASRTVKHGCTIFSHPHLSAFQTHVTHAWQRLQQQAEAARPDGQSKSQSPTGGFLAAFYVEQEVVAPPPEMSDKVLAFELTETLRRKVGRMQCCSSFNTFQDSFLVKASSTFCSRRYLGHHHCVIQLRSTLSYDIFIRENSNLPPVDMTTQLCGSSIICFAGNLACMFLPLRYTRPRTPGCRIGVLAREAGAARNGQRKSD